MAEPLLEFMDVETYLRTELESPYRREYVGCFAYPLHGTTPDAYGSSAAHNLIGGNLTCALMPSARRLGLRLYAYQLKLSIPASQSFLYPDLMLTRPKMLPTSAFHFDTDPLLLVEIISEETGRRDEVAKSGLYTAIPSLQTYLMVEQAERRVYVYQRQADSWTMQELVDAGEIAMPCLNRALNLDEIYDGVR